MNIPEGLGLRKFAGIGSFLGKAALVTGLPAATYGIGYWQGKRKGDKRFDDLVKAEMQRRVSPELLEAAKQRGLFK